VVVATDHPGVERLRVPVSVVVLSGAN
jgi:hypothetical protein